MIEPWQFFARDLEATRQLGVAIAQCAETGMVFGLSGTLGAGKTQLVKYVAQAAGVSPQSVVSPTFSLIQSYQGDRHSIVHMDLYRIADEDEFLELGTEEYLDSDAVVFIEWADRFAECLTDDLIWIQIEQTETGRNFVFSQSKRPREPELAALFLGCLKQQLEPVA